MGVFLHVGCGPATKEHTTKGFNSPDWEELRFDIDKNVSPDIIGTTTDMSAVADNSVDAVYSSHNIEHIYAHEVPVALAEFKRVLKPEGFIIITCPDLQSVCALVAEGKLTDAAYVSPAGPIAPIDILYGHRPPIAAGNLHMAHRFGFTEKTLREEVTAAGFTTIASMCRPAAFDLWLLALLNPISEDEVRALAQLHFPSLGS